MTYELRTPSEQAVSIDVVHPAPQSAPPDPRFDPFHLTAQACGCPACSGQHNEYNGPSFVSDYTALISGYSMSSTAGLGAFFTYSFPTEVPAYLYDIYTAEEMATFEEFSVAYQEVAREAVEAYASISGLTAFEAPAGQGDVQFMIFDLAVFSTNSWAGGFAYYPATQAHGSDIFIDNDSTGNSTNLGILLHELGHALGLQHPFDGDVRLEEKYDNYDYTVMSYTSNGNPRTALGPLDVDAVRYLYGDENADGNQITSWSWNASTYTLTQTGNASDETINGVGTADVIYGLGGNDTIYGQLGDDTLYGGDGADRLYGGEGDDVLEGGEGNDQLDGGTGSNALHGGGGDDTLSVTINGIDTWLEADGGAGTDQLTLTFRDFTGEFSLPDFYAASTIANIESFTYYFYAGAFSIEGSAENEQFVVWDGVGTIDAGAGDDYLYGGSQGTYLAGEGDDQVQLRIVGNVETLNADGGAGDDYLSLNFDDGAARNIRVSQLAVTGFEQFALWGNSGNDTFIADTGDGITLSGGGGNDLLVGGSGTASLRGGQGDDILIAGTGFSFMYGGEGADRHVFESLDQSPRNNSDQLEDFESGVDVLELGGFQIDDITIAPTSFGSGSYVTVTSGDSEMRIFVRTSITMADIGYGFYGGAEQDSLVGRDTSDRLLGYHGADTLAGGQGDDVLDGGAEIDTAIVAGAASAYTVTQTSVGVFTVAGPDGTDTLSNVEYLQFDDQTIRLLPGTGVSVNFETSDPSVYQSAMDAIRDFDGNALGGDGNWLRIGSADVDGDGDIDQILVNDAIGRFATVGGTDDGLSYFSDYSWAGETRVAGIYVDPLVLAGAIAPFSDEDSQRRFQNDLQIENINRVLGADDYDGDGLQEVYFGLTDGTAYLHAYMHADGNIQYANYQSEQQVIDYLTANGYDSGTWAEWFGASAEVGSDAKADAPAPAAEVSGIGEHAFLLETAFDGDGAANAPFAGDASLDGLFDLAGMAGTAAPQGVQGDMATGEMAATGEFHHMPFDTSLLPLETFA